MRSGRLATNGKPGRSIQLTCSVLEQIEDRVFTVVWAGRVWILRGEPVIDARGAEAGLVGEQFQRRILHVVRTKGPASAMNVEVDADRFAIGTDDAHFDRTAATGARPQAPACTRGVGWR